MKWCEREDGGCGGASNGLFSVGHRNTEKRALLTCPQMNLFGLTAKKNAKKRNSLSPIFSPFSKTQAVDFSEHPYYVCTQLGLAY